MYIMLLLLFQFQQNVIPRRCERGTRAIWRRGRTWVRFRYERCTFCRDIIINNNSNCDEHVVDGEMLFARGRGGRSRNDNVPPYYNIRFRRRRRALSAGTRDSNNNNDTVYNIIRSFSGPEGGKSRWRTSIFWRRPRDRYTPSRTSHREKRILYYIQDSLEMRFHRRWLAKVRRQRRPWIPRRQVGEIIAVKRLRQYCDRQQREPLDVVSKSSYAHPKSSGHHWTPAAVGSAPGRWVPRTSVIFLISSVSENVTIALENVRDAVSDIIYACPTGK